MSHLFDLGRVLWSGLPVSIGGVVSTLLMGHSYFISHRAAHMMLSYALGTCFSMSLERAMLLSCDPSHNRDIVKKKTKMFPKKVFYSRRVVSKLLLVMPSFLPYFQVFHRFSCHLVLTQVCLSRRYGMVQVFILIVFEVIRLWVLLCQKKKRGKLVQKAFQKGEIVGSIEGFSKHPKISHCASSQIEKGDDMINVTVDFRHCLRPNSEDFLQNRQLRERNQELEKENLILKTQLEQKKQENQYIEAMYEKKEIQFQRCQQENVALRETFEDSIIQLHSNAQQLEEALETIGGTEEKKLEYQNQVGELGQKIMMLETELNELEDKKFKLESALKPLEHKTTEGSHEATISYLQRKLNLFIDIEQINRQIAEINERMNGVKSDREWVNHEVQWEKYILLLRKDMLKLVKMCESIRFSMCESICLLDPFRTEPTENMEEEPHLEQQMAQPLDDDDQGDGQQEESMFRLDQRELSVGQEVKKLVKTRSSLLPQEGQGGSLTSEDVSETSVGELDLQIRQLNHEKVIILKEKMALLCARVYLSSLYDRQIGVGENALDQTRA